jgi:ribosomal protein S12 methylthiotransferase accessory factor
VIGVSCFSAIRPNAKTLATSQGKGLDDFAAMASAVMEAAEFSIAEHPPATDWHGTAASLEEAGAGWFSPQRFLPFGTAFDRTRAIGWVLGKGLVTGRPFMVPRDVIRFDGESSDLVPIAQSTNGLASGNTAREAEFHGLCELIERDATTMWTLMTAAERAARAIDLSELADKSVDALAAQIRSCGLRVVAFDLTSDVAVPTVLGIIGPVAGGSYFDYAAGYATHPRAGRAAARAIMEAAQSRITAIAGGRDDIDTSEYSRAFNNELPELVAARPRANAPIGAAEGLTLDGLLDFATDRLTRAGVEEPVAVSLGGDAFEISVVRVLSESLEDREVNANWRPGPRSISRLMGRR